MLRKIKFNHFVEGQTLYFDINRLEELERITGMSIADIMGSNLNIGILLSALVIGLKHEQRQNKIYYQQELSKFINNGGNITDIWIDITKALMLTGIFGKKAVDAVIEREENLEKNSERTD